MKPKIYKKHIEVPDSLKKLQQTYLQNSKKLYLVGGAVRDSLLGKTPKDFDLATDASPDETISMLKDSGFVKNILETGKQFGIVIVITYDGEEYEIARFRNDIGAGRRPDSVEFTTIDQDVMRRDLTINALFYDLQKGEVVDYVGGVEDLKNGIVRTVGDARDRFGEDPLRKLRVLRFAARIGSKLDKNTINALVNDNSLEGVSLERIRDEFIKGINSAKNVLYFLGLLYKFGFFKYILDMEPNPKDFANEKDHIIVISNILKNENIENIYKKLSGLRYTNKEVSDIVFLVSLLKLNVENVHFIKKLYKKSKTDKGKIYKFAKINNISPNVIKAFWSVMDFHVDGNMLKNLGFKNDEIGGEIKRLESERFKENL